MGGGTSSTSKICIIGKLPAKRGAMGAEACDVSYRFGQVICDLGALSELSVLWCVHFFFLVVKTVRCGCVRISGV